MLEPYLQDHGGDCCGIRHLYSFTTTPYQIENAKLNADSLLKRLKERNTSNSLIVEVVLTDQQLIANDNYWLKWLISHRFGRVTRMINPNSLNSINIFHWRSLDEDIRATLKTTDPWRNYKEK